MGFLEFTQRFLPIEIALVVGIFFYLLIFFKKIADKFIQLSKDQTEYMQQRLEVIEKTLGISDRAFDFHKKQIKALEDIASKQEEQIAESERARIQTEEELVKAEEKYKELLETLQLKEQQQEELMVARTQLESTVRREVISRVSHELLTPIQGIYATVENLLHFSDLSLSDEEIQENILSIQREIKRLTLLMRNAMTFVEGTYEYKPKLSKHDIIGLIHDTISLFADLARQEGLEIRFPIAHFKEPHLILIDEEKAQLVLYNLISNALKYSYRGLKDSERFINVDIIEKDEHYVISITNFGAGIKEDELQNVFKVGYRGALALDRNRTGMGMGLFAARSIMKALKGNLTIESKMTHGSIYLTTTRVTFPKTEVE